MKDTLFLTVFHNLPGVSDGIETNYYTDGEKQRLSWDLASAVKFYLDIFVNSYYYQEYFSSAEYVVGDDWLNDLELSIFRLAIDLDQRTVPLTELHPQDTLNGCYAVIESRIRSEDIADWRRGIDLFNDVMEAALSADEFSDPGCSILLRTTKEFAPEFISDLLDSVGSTDQDRWRSKQYPRIEFVGAAFRPLLPLLEMIKKRVDRAGWPQSDIALGKFLLILDHYQEVMRQWSV
jgi:hypothetical protein